MRAVSDALAETEGVSNCEIDFNTKTATCTIDPEKFDSDAALQKLAAAGFEKSEMKN